MKHNLVECTTCNWIGYEGDLQQQLLDIAGHEGSLHPPTSELNFDKCPMCTDIHVWNIDWVDAAPKLRQEYRKLSRRMEWSDDLYNSQRRHYIEQILTN